FHRLLCDFGRLSGDFVGDVLFLESVLFMLYVNSTFFQRRLNNLERNRRLGGVGINLSLFNANVFGVNLGAVNAGGF
ncbi:hypothetical protein QMM87_05775, partial [Leptospira santarosai]|nr:hypothetical protein [Leptospira santarosai]